MWRAGRKQQTRSTSEYQTCRQSDRTCSRLQMPELLGTATLLRYEAVAEAVPFGARLDPVGRVSAGLVPPLTGAGTVAESSDGDSVLDSRVGITYVRRPTCPLAARAGP